MVDPEKDRLGDKLRKKEKGHEEDYFARRDRELIEKLRRKQGGESDAEGNEKGGRN
jgi:hypothetical protein